LEALTGKAERTHSKTSARKLTFERRMACPVLGGNFKGGSEHTMLGMEAIGGHLPDLIFSARNARGN